MFKHRLEHFPSNRVVLHWYLLSFNGGFINAGGFLGTGRFVSHVTGFATLLGVHVASQQLEAAAGILLVPGFFLLGAFLAGMLIDRPIHLRKRPHFDYVMGLSALCLFLSAGGGELSKFGDFGGAAQTKSVYVLLSLLCLACGLQNGAITSSSGSAVRTTHLTGITTDLGLGLAKMFTYASQEETFKMEAVANRVRSGSIVSFALGSVVGSLIFVKFGYRGFFVPGLIASYAAYHGRKAKIAAHKQELPEGYVV